MNGPFPSPFGAGRVTFPPGILLRSDMTEATIDAGRAREEAARRDRDRMQGVWKFVSGKREARLLISGDYFTMHFKNGDVYVGTFTLDANARPKAMDLSITEGPEAHRGKKALAIYEFDADHLI